MENFDDFLIKTTARLKIEQDHFMTKFNIEKYKSWNYDQVSGIFTFSNDLERLFFKFQSIGTYSKKSNTWMWAWANMNTYPKVRIDSERIKDFGHENNYLKLIESKWNADEIDGWDMLSIANWILKPLGVYRIPTESHLMFVIFTEEINEVDSINLKEYRKQLVNCSSHGLRQRAFVCQHLDLESRKGFNESFDTCEGMDLEIDDDFQAWCDQCEKTRVRYDGWNEESMKYAKIKVICEKCYFDLKRINK